MPKGRVNTSYQRAGSSPSERTPERAKISDPKPRKKRKDLYAYVRDNEDTGIPYKELIEQFQLYECDHPQREQEVVGSTSTKLMLRCNKCHWNRSVLKPGAKNG